MSILNLDTGEVSSAIEEIVWDGGRVGQCKVRLDKDEDLIEYLEENGDSLYLDLSNLNNVIKALTKAAELWGTADEQVLGRSRDLYDYTDSYVDRGYTTTRACVVLWRFKCICYYEPAYGVER